MRTGVGGPRCILRPLAVSSQSVLELAHRRVAEERLALGVVRATLSSVRLGHLQRDLVTHTQRPSSMRLVAAPPAQDRRHASIDAGKVGRHLDMR
eukprot:scaffold3183_cov120-Isochrysis_galbana.AAC.14